MDFNNNESDIFDKDRAENETLKEKITTTSDIDIKPTVDIVIPTYKPDANLLSNLKKITEQTYPVNKIMLINTGKEYMDEEQFTGIPNLYIHHIKIEEFDHGRTRDLGIQMSEADIVMFMTQDAIPANNTLVASLVANLSDERIAVAYARQLPREDCSYIERYTRAFNYPDKSYVKTKKDIEKMGIKAYFCSDVCAAYNRKIYNALGGFIKKTIFNEDMIFAAKAINNGYGVCYSAESQVIHSHNYTFMKQLRRNFDLGVSQSDNPQVFANVKSESEGMKLVKSTVKYLISTNKWYLIPEFILTCGFKFIGYRLGKNYSKLPKWLIMRLTMDQKYWTK